MNFWIIVCQAAIIGFGNIVSLGNRQEVDKYLPGLRIDVADTVEKPIELLFASHEHTAKDDPKTSLRMTLGVHERECCPPGTAKHQPHFNAQKRAQCFNIVHKVVGGVVGDVGIRRGPPSAALIASFEDAFAALGSTDPADWDGTDNANGSNPAETREQDDAISSSGVGAAPVPDIHWQNRPTYQQVVQPSRRRVAAEGDGSR